MEVYKVIRILEEDFGCEGRPDGYEPMCTVQLQAASGEAIFLKVKDKELYAKDINEDDSVTVDDGIVEKSEA